jgi:hypothetical protein
MKTNLLGPDNFSEIITGFAHVPENRTGQAFPSFKVVATKGESKNGKIFD